MSRGGQTAASVHNCRLIVEAMRREPGGVCRTIRIVNRVSPKLFTTAKTRAGLCSSVNSLLAHNPQLFRRIRKGLWTLVEKDRELPIGKAQA